MGVGVAMTLPNPAWAAADVLFRLETALGHNTNPLRTAYEEATVDTAQASPTARLRADLGVSWDLGHPANRLQLTHQLLRRTYTQVPGLDGSTQYSTATLAWASVPWISLRLSTSWRDNPERLDTGDTTTLNGRQTTQAHSVALVLKPTPTWSIPWRMNQQSSHTDAAIPSESGQSNELSHRTGVMWSPQPGRSVWLGMSHSRLDTTPVLWAAGASSGLARNQTQGVEIDWRVSPKTQLTAALGAQRWSLPITDQPHLTTTPLSLGVDYRYSSITRLQYQYRSQTVADFSARSGLTQQRIHDWALNWAHSPKTRLRVDLTRAQSSPAFQDGGQRGSESTRQWALGTRLEYEWQRPWTAFVEWGLERKEIQGLSGPPRYIRQTAWLLGLRYDWERSRYDRDAMSIQALP